jgi:hypothetical protein
MASSIMGGMSSALAKSEYLNSAGQMLQKSKVLASASDSVRRVTGVDVRRAMGGKSAADIAEERIKGD